MCDLLGQLYVFLITSCKRFYLKILNYMKKWKKFKKDPQSFCEIILLAPIYVFVPNDHMN
jgi:hypothetical protein